MTIASAADADADDSVGVRPLLSVVMPAYNEAGNIGGAITDVIDHVFAVVPASELVIVDDGSRDGTAAIAAGSAQRDHRVRVMSQANAGHGPALLRGLREARGDWCLLLDSDRQVGLASFADTWRLAQGHDAVLGVRRARDDPRHRLLLSAALRVVMAVVLRTRASDANAPYKLVRREHIALAVQAMPAQARIPSILLTVYLHRQRLRIIEQPVPHFARSAGASTLHLRRLARFCAPALRELLRFARLVTRRR